MATAYKSDNYISQLRIVSTAADFTQPFAFTVSTAFVINDTVTLCAIPEGCNVLEWYLDVPDVDSATSFAFQLGDSGSATRFLAANTTGQAAGIVYSQKDGALGILPRYYSTFDNVILKVSTAPGTGTTGGVFKGAVKFNKIGPVSGT